MPLDVALPRLAPCSSRAWHMEHFSNPVGFKPKYSKVREFFVRLVATEDFGGGVAALRRTTI